MSFYFGAALFAQMGGFVKVLPSFKIGEVSYAPDGLQGTGY
jgi:hypothetical protein